MVAKAAGATRFRCRRAKPSRDADRRGDVVTTSATSLISFRLQEVSKHLTISKTGKSYWFMLEPLLMSKAMFDKLPKDQQTLIMTVGAEMEKFALEAPGPTMHRSPRPTSRPAPRFTTSPTSAREVVGDWRTPGLEGLRGEERRQRATGSSWPKKCRREALRTFKNKTEKGDPHEP